MRHVSRNFVLVLTAIAATVMSVASQTPPAQKPSFEVASVRLSPNQSLGGTGLLYTLPGGKLTANAAMLRVLIFNAGRNVEYTLRRDLFGHREQVG